MQKISKTQFLELVELSIAVHSAEVLHNKGQKLDTDAYKESLDDAIADYVFWTHSGTGRPYGPEELAYYTDDYSAVLAHWTHDDEQSN